MATEDLSATGYHPTFGDDAVKRIRRWHEHTYRSAKDRASSGQRFDYFGISIEVPPEVMPVTPLSEVLGRAVLDEVRADDRVLDMGTGSGIDAILAASKATDVVAVDVNPRAVETARRNAERNGVGDRVDVRRSDVFSAVDGTFDLVIFNPPARWFPARDLLETASTDPGYRALTTFVREVGDHLSARGRMLIFFGTTGDLGYLRNLLVAGRYEFEVVGHRAKMKDGVHVDYYAHRVIRAG